ncbi:MAG: hypothetical protein Fur0037_08070 [Planctomycetota bacterium]
MQDLDRTLGYPSSAGRSTVRPRAGLVLLVSLAASPAAQAPPRPSVLLILADDLGWTDLSAGSARGGNASPCCRTPCLEALGRKGTCFPNARGSAPNRAPTRASRWSGQSCMWSGTYTVGSDARGAVGLMPVRTLDLYPTLLSIAGCEIARGRCPTAPTRRRASASVPPRSRGGR